MDQNGIVLILFGILAVLIVLYIVLRPWKDRAETEKKLKDEAKQNRIDEVAANKIAANYEKKGRL